MYPWHGSKRSFRSLRLRHITRNQPSAWSDLIDHCRITPMRHRRWVAMTIGACYVRAFSHLPARFWPRGIGATVAKLNRGAGGAGAGAQSAAQIRSWNWYPPPQPVLGATVYTSAPPLPSAIMTVLACAASTPSSRGKRAIGGTTTRDDEVGSMGIHAHTHAHSIPLYPCMRVQATPPPTTTPTTRSP